MHRLREHAVELALADYQDQQAQFARLGADRMADLLRAADAVADELPGGELSLSWAVAPLLRDTGVRLVMTGASELQSIGFSEGVEAHGHPSASPNGVDECPKCKAQGVFTVAREVANRPGDILSIQFPVVQTYRRFFAGYSGSFRSYIWVMRRDGMVVLSPDQAASGTRPFDDPDLDPSVAKTLGEVKSLNLGRGVYRWAEPDGQSAERLVAWHTVPGQPDLVVLHSADRAAAIARTDAFSTDARWLVIVMAFGLIALACFIGLDTQYRIQRERRAKDQLALTEARFRTMVGQAADMLLEVSADQTILSINDAAKRALGDVVGHTLGDVLEFEHDAVLKSAARRLKAHQSIDDLKVRARSADGRAIPVSVRASSIEVAGIKPFQHWALRDLSGAEREQQRVAQMEKLSTIGRLTATVSHEIKNPLSSIHTNAEYAKTLVSDEPHEMRDVLNDILEAVGQIDGIVTAVGGVVRPKPNHRLIDMRDTVKSAMVLAGARLSKGRTLTVDLPEPLSVVGAAGELSQIAVNLLVNAAQAIKHVENGQVRVLGRCDDGTVVMRFEDNGPGIDPENLAQLFDPFFTTRATGEGTGLGLAISREIAERHGGQLTCESQPGSTVFELRIPAAQVAHGSPVIAA